MIGNTQHIDAVRLEVLPKFEQRGTVFHLERDMLHPLGRVGVAPHRRLGGQLKKSQYIAVTRIEKHMHVRVWRLGRGHQVLGNRQHKVHFEHGLVPQNRFLGVFAAVGHMVNAIDLHHGASTVMAPRRT